MITIWHNNRCSKSRNAVCLLEGKNVQAEVFEYLKTPPTADQIKEVIQKLGIEPEALVRKGEEIYKTEFKGRELSSNEWIEAFVKYPVLIERPIIIKGDRAVIGRPIENIENLLD
jgi:arsenate reductase (glutaredoxin)